MCRCNGGPHQSQYKFELEFFGEVDPEQCKKRKTDRHMTMVLEKKDKKGHFWPRLTESKAKVHFVHTDFNLWKDEDDTSDEDDKMNDDFQSVLVALCLWSYVLHDLCHVSHDLCHACVTCHVT